MLDNMPGWSRNLLDSQRVVHPQGPVAHTVGYYTRKLDRQLAFQGILAIERCYPEAP